MEFSTNKVVCLRIIFENGRSGDYWGNDVVANAVGYVYYCKNLKLSDILQPFFCWNLNQGILESPFVHLAIVRVVE